MVIFKCFFFFKGATLKHFKFVRLRNIAVPQEVNEAYVRRCMSQVFNGHHTKKKKEQAR